MAPGIVTTTDQGRGFLMLTRPWGGHFTTRGNLRFPDGYPPRLSTADPRVAGFSSGSRNLQVHTPRNTGPPRVILEPHSGLTRPRFPAVRDFLPGRQNLRQGAHADRGEGHPARPSPDNLGRVGSLAPAPLAQSARLSPRPAETRRRLPRPGRTSPHARHCEPLSGYRHPPGHVQRRYGPHSAYPLVTGSEPADNPRSWGNALLHGHRWLTLSR